MPRFEPQPVDPLARKASLVGQTSSLCKPLEALKTPGFEYANLTNVYLFASIHTLTRMCCVSFYSYGKGR